MASLRWPRPVKLAEEAGGTHLGFHPAYILQRPKHPRDMIKNIKNRRTVSHCVIKFLRLAYSKYTDVLLADYGLTNRTYYGPWSKYKAFSTGSSIVMRRHPSYGIAQVSTRYHSTSRELQAMTTQCVSTWCNTYGLFQNKQVSLHSWLDASRRLRSFAVLYLLRYYHGRRP